MTKPLTPPTPAQVQAARGELTHADAAAVVYCKQRAWYFWESGERQMPLATWELFLRKTDQWPPTNKLLRAAPQPETEADGTMAEAQRRLKVRRTLQAQRFEQAKDN